MDFWMLVNNVLEETAYDCIKKSLIITTKSKTKQNFYKFIIPHFPLERGEYGYK